MSSASLKFVIEGDPAPAVKAMRTVTGEAQKSSTSIGSSFKKLAGLAGGLFAANTAVNFVKGTITAASDLSETVNKSSVIFGENASAVQDWSNSSVDAMGLSQQAALEAAASFGDMFTQIGFTGGQAVSMSEQVVQLAADLGSFNNLPTDDVLDRIAGGFRGEYDALQKLIPNISATRVQQEALNETHKKSVTDLTAAEKATATLNIVMKDGKKASGDFAATSDGLANQQKILSATVEDLQAKLGQDLVPILGDAAGALSGVLDWVGRNKKAVEILAGVVGGLWLAWKGYKILTAVSAAYTGLMTKMAAGNALQRAAAGNMRNLAGAAGVATAAIVLVAKAWSDNSAKQSRAKAAMQDLQDAITADSLTIGKNTREVVANKLEQDGVYKIAQRAGIGLDEVTDAALGNAAAQKKLREQLGPAAAELKISGSEAQQLGIFTLGMADDVDSASAAAHRLNSVTSKTADSQKDAAGAIKDTGVQASTTKDAIDALQSAFDRLNGRTIDAAEAEIAWQDSLANATKELKGNNKALTLDTKTGRDHLQVVFDSIKAAQDDAEATLERTNSSKKARAAFQSDIGTLKQHMIALGFDKGKVQELIAEYGRTPKFEVTKFDAQTAAAQQAASNLADTMDALRQAVIIPVHIEQSGTFHVPGSGVQGQASGTGSAPAGWSWVGERGPELMNFRGGERVLSHPQSMRVSRGYAAGTGTITTAGPQRVTGRMRLEVDGQGGLWALLDGVVDDKLEHRRSVIGMDR